MEMLSEAHEHCLELTGKLYRRNTGALPFVRTIDGATVRARSAPQPSRSPPYVGCGGPVSHTEYPSGLRTERPTIVKKGTNTRVSCLLSPMVHWVCPRSCPPSWAGCKFIA